MVTTIDGSVQLRTIPDCGKRDSDLHETTTAELIDHIVRTHHAYLRKELPILSRAVTDMYRVHGATHPEVAELHIRFHELKTEIEHHMIAEEEAIFPQILKAERTRTAEGAEAVFTIGELEAEHGEIASMLRNIRGITLDCFLPEESCRMFKQTFSKLQEMELDISRHIHLESDLLFPKYRSIGASF